MSVVSPCVPLVHDVLTADIECFDGEADRTNISAESVSDSVGGNGEIIRIILVIGQCKLSGVLHFLCVNKDEPPLPCGHIDVIQNLRNPKMELRYILVLQHDRLGNSKLNGAVIVYIEIKYISHDDSS